MGRNEIILRYFTQVFNYLGTGSETGVRQGRDGVKRNYTEVFYPGIGGETGVRQGARQGARQGRDRHGVRQGARQG